MAGFNGSGTFVRTYNWVTDKSNSVAVTASRVDTEDDGFATGLSTCICKDGQTTTTAKIPFSVGISINDGSVGTPAILFTSDTDSGVYRIGANNVGVALGGGKVLDLGTATSAFTGSLTVGGSLSVSATATVGGSLAVLGTASVAGALFVSGNTTIGGNLTVTGSFALPGISGYLFGCILSNDGTTPNTKLDISAGVAMDSGNTVMMTLAAIVKTTGATWTVGTGNGGLDAGSVASSTTYHVYVIERTDTGVVDVLFSTSASSPTMPANYTKKRRIGSFMTDGSSNIVRFTQIGDVFRLTTSTTVVNAITTGSAWALTACGTPAGVNVQPILTGWQRQNAVGSIFSSVGDGADSGETNEIDTAWTRIATEAQYFYINGGFFTNTSSQIYTQTTITSGTLSDYTLKLCGWIDNRGRLS